ncbi:complex I subunit 5 family protein [Rubrobacter indicoceani]|uniref:complex I subunit 5 family protein n=1 Tax=Rubrobacter indicoceani TaxID=2051957 RepID=UPI000E5B7C7B|nr:complex I subunit 5 family protein [Rubrobacter indicoceani]
MTLIDSSSGFLFSAAWVSTFFVPLLLAVLLAPAFSRRLALAGAPLAALPALAVGVFGGSGVEIPWLLLGTRLGLSEVTRVFLIFTALLWLAAGVYARSYTRNDAAKVRFFAFFLATMAGNLGLLVARDLAGFYLFFTLMSFAAYGLIVHDLSDRARRASRVYLIMVVIGEAFVLPAVILTAATTNGDFDTLATGISATGYRDVITLLALVGFGVKAGALPVHLWLPLAHPAAPTPASAVLSGSMIKAGLLGWLTFTPAGATQMPVFGTACLVIGLGAVFYGVFAGLAQSEPKTILAYSSISQMGLMTLALGVGLAFPAAWPAALAAILVYATHHALAKGALFLGVGVADEAASRGSGARVLALGGLLLAALVIAGAPLTSGSLAKEFLKEASYAAQSPWDSLLEPLIQLGAVGTTLLMMRFLHEMHGRLFPADAGERSSPARLSPGLAGPWFFLLGGMFAVLGFLDPPPSGLLYALLSFSALWPVVLGAALYLVFGLSRQVRLPYPKVPEGDLIVPVSRAISGGYGAAGSSVKALRAGLSGPASQTETGLRKALGWLGDRFALTEVWLRKWTVSGGIVLTLTVALFLIAALR